MAESKQVFLKNVFNKPINEPQMTSRIIITGSFRFPDGDAAAARVLGIGQALQAAGYMVEFAGWEEKERHADLQPDGKHLYQGFHYTSQGDLRHTVLPPIKRLIRYLFAGTNTLSWLRTNSLTDVKAIIAYHGGSMFLLRLLWLCKRRKIPLLFDCTEWYNNKTLPGGRFGLAAVDNEFRMRILNPIIAQGIVISSYLEDYYKRKKCKILRVPPLINTLDNRWQVHNEVAKYSDKLKIVYAGTPGKKDLLGVGLRAIDTLNRQGAMIELHIIGPSLEAVARCIDDDWDLLGSLGPALHIHGRVSQSEVPRLIAAADFSMLLRPQLRYAQAGFSTKLVESLAAGVPVIANKTSDIHRFIRDGIEGILLEDHSEAAFMSGLKRAMALSPDMRALMRRNARLQAGTHFDFRNHVDNLSRFMQQF